MEGSKSNRDGIGTRIVAIVGDKRMERRVRTGSSYLSHSETTVTFGLGNATGVDSLIVYWPSNRIDKFKNVNARQEIKIVEGTGVFEKTPLSNIEPLAIN